MTVELLISGISTKASWTLAHREFDMLLEQLSVLPGTLSSHEPCFLGYHGLRVILSEAETLVINRGMVEVYCTNGSPETRRFMDFNREFEAWIFSTGRGRMPVDIYNRLSKDEFSLKEKP